MLRHSRDLTMGLLTILLLVTGCQPTATELDFLVLDSQHFTIHYIRGNEGPAEDVLTTLETNFDRIITNQQPLKQDKYILWLYPNSDTFHQAIGMPEAPDWVVGRSVSEDEMAMVSPGGPGPPHSYESLLQVAVHEFTHCVTNRLAAQHGVGAVIWLWECIATYEAGQIGSLATLPYIQTGELPPFLDGTSGLDDIYELGYWIANYIINSWGWEGMRALVACGGDVRQALGVTEDEFYAGCYESIRFR